MAVTTRILENFIGGRWVPASGGGTVDDLNPADPSDVLARIPLSSADDARALKNRVDAIVVGAAFMRAVAEDPARGAADRADALARALIGALA